MYKSLLLNFYRYSVLFNQFVRREFTHLFYIFEGGIVLHYTILKFFYLLHF